MTASEVGEGAVAAPAAGRTLRVSLALARLLYGLVPVLGLLSMAEPNAALVGAGLACYAVTAVVSVPLAGRISRVCGPVLLGVALGLLPDAGAGWGRYALLALAGLGVGVHRGLSPVGGRRMVLVSALGAFLHAQVYSAFALQVAHGVSSAPLRVVLLAGPAVGVILLRAPVAGLVRRLMRVGAEPFTVLADAALLFGVAMLLLGMNFPVTLGAILAMAVFSLAMAMFAVLPVGSSRLCWTGAEALGSLAGGLFLALSLWGDGRIYWLVLAVLTLVGTTMLIIGKFRQFYYQRSV